MLVTEEEAKTTKWCPETRAGIFSGEQTLCIGSKCMAWRWRFPGRDTDRSQNDDRALGYCGKAGLA